MLQRETVETEAFPRWMRLVFSGATAALFLVFFVPAFFIASVLPYRYWDSLAFGTWSRLIADRGHFWFPDQLFDSQAGRPVFYVGQGLIWLAFGYHEWLGRWFSGLLDVLLAVLLYVLAGRLTRDALGRAAIRLLAVAIILAGSVFAAFATEGLTDLPVATMAALTAVVFWSRRLGRAHLPLIALVTAGTILTKPAGLVAIAGIGLASTVDARQLGRRLWAKLGALAGGIVLALAYDSVMAHRFNERLTTFLRAGTFVSFVGERAHRRSRAFTSYDWLAALVVLAVAFGVAYAVLRAFDVKRRTAAWISAAAAVLWTLASVRITGKSSLFFSKLGKFRWDAVLRADWLGSGVGLVVVYGIVWGVARAVGLRARTAAAISAPLALLWVLAGPAIALHKTPYPFDQGFGLDIVAWFLIAATIVAAPFLSPREIVGRTAIARLILMAAPGALLWFSYRPDQVRFLSPIWPPLVLLAAAALGSAVLSLTALGRAVALVPVAAVTLLVIANVVSIDGLGTDQWRSLLRQGSSNWGRRAAMENFAYGPFSYELTASRTYIGDGKLISSDGRLQYFFPGRVDITNDLSCSRLRGHRVLAILTSSESAAQLTHAGVSVDPLSWLQCRSPRVFEVDEQPGINATFVIGRPPVPRPALAACGIHSYAGQLSDAVFADGVSYAKAREIQTAASKVGFGPKIERTGCSTFHVVVTGVPNSSEQSFRKEAAGAGFHVAFVPAVRYPEVAADVRPAG